MKAQEFVVKFRMDEGAIQALIAERQDFCFAILNVIYESEYPITIETIAFRLQRPVTIGFAALLARLAGTGYIRSQIIDGLLHYTKPLSPSQLRLPLPYYVFDLYPDDLRT